METTKSRLGPMSRSLVWTGPMVHTAVTPGIFTHFEPQCASVRARRSGNVGQSGPHASALRLKIPNEPQRASVRARRSGNVGQSGPHASALRLKIPNVRAVYLSHCRSPYLLLRRNRDPCQGSFGRLQSALTLAANLTVHAIA